MLNECIIIICSPLTVSLFPHVLISLIKLMLWLKFSTNKSQAEDTGLGGEGPSHPAPFYEEKTKELGDEVSSHLYMLWNQKTTQSNQEGLLRSLQRPGRYSSVPSILCAHRNIFVLITLADKSDEICLDEHIVLIGSAPVSLGIGPPFCHLRNLFCGSHSRKNCSNIWSVKEQMKTFLKPQVTRSHFYAGMLNGKFVTNLICI